MKKILSMLLIGSLMLPLMLSCSSDDDEVEINNYIIGAWKSYKVVEYYDFLGEGDSYEVTKNGSLSSYYIEMDIKDNGTLVFSYWTKGKNGQSQWVEGLESYTIKGDILSITDSSSDTMDFVFDSKAKTLCLLINASTQKTISLYLKKK